MKLLQNLLPGVFSLILFPSVALANESGRGTLIMVSSIGFWVLGGAVLFKLRKTRHQARRQAEPAKTAPTPEAPATRF